MIIAEAHALRYSNKEDQDTKDDGNIYPPAESVKDSLFHISKFLVPDI